MGSRLKMYSFLRLSLCISLGNLLCAGACSEEESPYLAAVREFADNVLKYGRDVYGEKHTPLFVDGLNIHTHEPVKWIAPNGQKWILSNLASQQNLFRTLDGLTAITGDPKYRQAAVAAVEYAFANLRSPNGLLYWGGHCAYDAQADRPCGRTGQHELKALHPYYELMWQVNPEATKQFIESFWSAHILDWSNLDMNRHGSLNQTLGKPWGHKYKAGPVFFKGRGISFSVTGSDLSYAAASLTKLSGDKQPLVWGKHLVRRYVQTRNPKTGISARVYTRPWSDSLEDLLAEDFKRDVLFHGMEFPAYWRIVDVEPHVCRLLLGEMLGDDGREFAQWALEELTAWGRAAYRKEDNSFLPMLIDGTNLEGYVLKKGSDYGPKGTILKVTPAGPRVFWAYALAYGATGDEFMWEMARSTAKGNDLGDIGASAKDKPQLRMRTDCSEPYVLIGLLELARKTGKKAFLNVARRISDNILANQFHKGFFVPSKKHIYSRFGDFEALALLHLDAAVNSRLVLLPRIWPSWYFFEFEYRGKDITSDTDLLYTLTESPEPPVSLQEAATLGDVDLVRSLLEKGAGVDAREDSFYKTALHRAAIGGHKDAAELLLAKGADVEAIDAFPCATPLHYAAEKGHKEIAELLIARGADVNARRGYPAGDRALHSAARAGHTDIVELLMAKGANVNARDNDGQTALDIAVRWRRTAVAHLLVEKGAEVSTIHLAASIGNLAKVISFLEKGTEVDAKNSAGATPLYSAVSGGHTDVAKLLMEKGADVNFGKEWGWPLLHDAANSGHKEIAELLLTNGADVNVKDKSGYSPLHYALWNSDEDMTKLLINKGADWKAKDSSGYTTLHWAVMMGSEELTKFLLTKGADVNAKSNDGETPLDVAAYGSPRGVGELLVEKGAEVSTLPTAAYMGDLAKVKGFIKEDADINGQNVNGGTPLHAAAAGGRKEVLEFLIAEGADIKARDKSDMTPLHTAARAGQRDAVELLLSKGADVNSKSRGGLTALHYAAMRGHRDVTELLLDKGADVNAKTGVGVTPLHAATTVGSKEVVELLIAKGADVNATDRMGRNALSRAKEKGHDEIAELLLKHGAKE